MLYVSKLACFCIVYLVIDGYTMNLVFNEFNLCSDLCDIISLNIHERFQIQINNHISIMIRWDENYNYLDFHNNIDSDLILHTNNILEQNLNELCKLLIKLKITDFNEVYEPNKYLSNEQYAKYCLSKKKIFNLSCVTRFNHMIVDLTYLLCKILAEAEKNSDTELILKIEEFGEYLQDLCKLHNKNTNYKYKNSSILSFHNKKINDPIRDFITEKNVRKNIYTKDLIEYLIDNGVKLENIYSKSNTDLWKLILKL